MMQQIESIEIKKRLNGLKNGYFQIDFKNKNDILERNN